jgi:ubiquitin-protein ligase
MAFMRNRVELDLKQLLAEINIKRDHCERSFVGSHLGNQFAFIEIRLKPHWGFSKGREIIISIKITLDYPYEPPIVYNYDDTFCHPNKDPSNSRLMFSFVDRQFWKPVFELSQVICGLEMILITPDLNYTNLKNMSLFSQAAINWIKKMSRIQNSDAGCQREMCSESLEAKGGQMDPKVHDNSMRTPEKELQMHNQMVSKSGMDIEFQSEPSPSELDLPADATYPSEGNLLPGQCSVLGRKEVQCRQGDPMQMDSAGSPRSARSWLCSEQEHQHQQPQQPQTERVLRRVLPLQSTN